MMILVVIQLNGCATFKTEIPKTMQPDEAKPADIQPSARYASIVAVGDIMLGGKGQNHYEQAGYDYPFAATRQLLQDGDIVIGNLETPLTNAGKPFADKKYVFRNPPDKVAHALKQAGFGIVSLANNHTMDYGEEGLFDTIDALNKAGVRHHGAGANLTEARKAQVFTLENGLTIGFLAYTNTLPEEFWAAANKSGTAFGHERHVREDVRKLVEQDIDIIVVSFHWGQERDTKLRSYQPSLAHAAIDAGADLIVGHHPHILQAVEKYKQGLIFYSLGNYTFSTFSPHVHSSVIARVSFIDGVYDSVEMTPININNFEVRLQPQVLVGAEAQKVFMELSKISMERGTELHLRNDVFELQMGEEIGN